MADNEQAITPSDVKALLTEYVSRERQTYVGMRYVPKFADPIEWDSDTEYEPLTMVTHNDAVYVSKFYVPADIDISETEYWALWGSLGTGVVDFDTLTDAVRSAYVRTFDTVSDMQSATDLLAGMTCHTNGLSSEGDGGAAWYTVGAVGDVACQNDLYATQVNIGEQHLGIMVLGDSYGEGYIPNGHVVPWISIFRSAAEQYGYTVHSSALGGAGFYNSDSAKKFSTLATNLIATLTDAQKNSIEAVIIGGGYNDRTNTRANIYSGMVELRDVINNNLPNVRRVLIFPFGMGVQGLTTGDHAGFTYSTIVDMINNYIDADCEAKLGVVIGESNMVLRRNTYFSSDYVHPNGSGSYVLGCFVADVFFGEVSSHLAAKFNDNYQPNLVIDSTVSPDTSFQAFRVFTSDTQFILSCPQGLTAVFPTTFNFTCDGAHPVTLATFADAAIQQYGTIVIPVSATVRSATSSPLRYQQIHGLLLIENGVVKFNATATQADGTNYLTVESVDRIQMFRMGNPSIDGLTLVG